MFKLFAWPIWQCLHGMVEAHMEKEKTSESVDEHWCKLQHLRGCSLLAKAQRGLNLKEKERITSEAVRCFFRYDTHISCSLYNNASSKDKKYYSGNCTISI